MGPDDETSKIPGVELTRKHPLTPATRPALLSILAGRLGYGFQELHAALETELRVNAGQCGSSNARNAILLLRGSLAKLDPQTPAHTRKVAGTLSLCLGYREPARPKTALPCCACHP